MSVRETIEKNETLETCESTNCKAMLMWLVLVLFFVYQFIARSSFPSVLLKNFTAYFGITATKMGVLTCCYYAIYTAMQIPVGIIVDKFSIRLISTITTAICALGIYFFIATTNYYIAACGQIMIGFGAAFAFIAVVKTITNWFPANKIAMLTAATISIGSLGPVIASPSIAYITKFYPWRSIMIIFAGVGLLLAFLIWIVVRDKEEVSSQEEKENFSVLDSLKLILKAPQAWILGLFTMAMYAPLSALADLWGASFIQKAYSVDNEIAASINSMLYVGLVIGSLTFAWLAYKIDSYKKTMMSAAILGLVAFSTILFSPSLPVIAVFILMFLMGLACGGMLTYPLGMILFPKKVSGTVTSFINMLSMLSGVILQPTIGIIMDWARGTRVHENATQALYTVADYRYGLSSVLIFLIIAVVFAYFMEDRSPKASH